MVKDLLITYFESSNIRQFIWHTLINVFLMDYTFYFESKFRTRRNVNYLKFQVPDGTEFVLSEEWMVSTQRNKRTPMQRLIFLKRNNYDITYRITVEISSVNNTASGKIVLFRQTKPLRTSVIILLSDFRQLEYSVEERVTYEEVEISRRIIHDIFKYKITVIRLHAFQEGIEITPDNILIMSNQLHSLMINKDFPDVIIRGTCSIHGVCEIKAHRNILSARSVYFSCMFENQWLENVNKRIKFKEIDMILVKEMVHYIYTGIIRPMKFSVMFDLYMVAHRFFLNDLKMLLSKELEKSLNVQNSVGIFILAYYSSDANLKRISLDFIGANFDSVQNTEFWLSLLHNEDYSRILDYPEIIEILLQSLDQE